MIDVSTVIEIACEQGTDEWLNHRAGACTASRFTLARQRVGMLTEQQATYVAALKAGMPEAEAMRQANYKAKPTSSAIQKALQGLPVGGPSELAKKYAMLLAIERIYGTNLDDTFVTWQMRRGTELEPVAREIYMERTGYIVDTAGLVLTADRMFGYSTDGKVYGHKGRVEIKNPAAGDKVAGVWIDPAPVIEEYMDQCDGGLWLTADEWIDLVVYTPWLAKVGRDLFIHRIYRDEQRIDALVADLMDFYRLTTGYEAQLRTPLGIKPEPATEPPPWAEPTAPKQAAAPLPDNLFS